jgi:hypothetical protein
MGFEVLLGQPPGYPRDKPRDLLWVHRSYIYDARKSAVYGASMSGVHKSHETCDLEAMTKDESTKGWIISTNFPSREDAATTCTSRAFWEGFVRGISAQTCLFTSTDYIWKSLEDFDSVSVAWSSVGHALDTAIVETAEQLEQSAEEISTEAVSTTDCEGIGAARELAS